MRKQKSKKKNFTIIAIAIISIFFLTISVGYSYLQQKMNIYGKATITTDKSGKYINGNSTYQYQIISSNEYEESNYKIYSVKINVVNMDKDITSWEVAFDVPKGYEDALSETQDGTSKKCENGRIIIKPKDGKGYLSKGNTLELEIKLAINGELNINNLTLNGRLASKVK